MKHLLLTTIAAVLVVGCVTNTSIYEAAEKGKIREVKLYLAAGTDVNAKDNNDGWIPLHYAAYNGRKEIAELLISQGADMNANDVGGRTPLDLAIQSISFPKGHPETADLLRKHGGKTGEELKAE